MSTNSPSAPSVTDQVRHAANTFSFWVLVFVMGLLILIAAAIGLFVSIGLVTMLFT